MTRFFFASLVMASLPLIATSAPRTAERTQTVTLRKALQIPDEVLQPGTYTFSVEDRLNDRALVRINDRAKDKDYLLLTAPNRQLREPSSKDLITFGAPDANSEILRAWRCPHCSAALEFVYPKGEAVKITADTGESALAVDPVSDKLPENLSAADMRVVTLWLLSPKRVSARHRGEGVSAAKLNSVKDEKRSSDETELASTSMDSEGRKSLPKTASNTFSLGLGGLLLLFLATALRLRRSTPSNETEQR